jgi:hypothetical protein
MTDHDLSTAGDRVHRHTATCQCGQKIDTVTNTHNVRCTTCDRRYGTKIDKISVDGLG